jgi:hypothetical protein
MVKVAGINSREGGRVADRLAKCRVPQLTMSSQGEPRCHPEIPNTLLSPGN